MPEKCKQSKAQGQPTDYTLKKALGEISSVIFTACTFNFYTIF